MIIVYGISLLYYLNSEIVKNDNDSYTEQLSEKISNGRLCCEGDDKKYIKYLESGLVLFSKNNEVDQNGSIWLLTQIRDFIILVGVVFLAEIISLIILYRKRKSKSSIGS